jgi:aspartate/methionine/tyrosine aminotransferase
LLDLTQGVPKQPPHESFLKALSEISASAEGAKYGAILGEPSLREALAAEIRLLYQLNGGPTPSDNVSGARAGDGDAISNEHMELGTQEGGEGGGVTAEDLAITTGCNMAFLVVLMALCPPHTSSVMLPLPNYFNHAMSLSLQSVKPVYIPCDPDNSFTPSISSARKYLQAQATAPGDHSVKVRMIVLCTPSNPTGRGYSHEELKEWYHLAREYKVALVLDETYRDFVEGSDGKRGVPHGLFREKDWRSTVVSLGSFSSA